MSVSDLYIPRIGPHFACSRLGRSIVEIYKSLTDTNVEMRKSFSGNICFQFSVLVLCSVAQKEWGRQGWRGRTARPELTCVKVVFHILQQDIGRQEEGRECMNGRLHPESPNPLFATLDLLEYREGYGSGTWVCLRSWAIYVAYYTIGCLKNNIPWQFILLKRYLFFSVCFEHTFVHYKHRGR